MAFPTNLQLTNEQRKLLVKIKDAPTPKLAFIETNNGKFAMAATYILSKLKLITVDQTTGEVHITDDGTNVMTAENLIDQSGQLTDFGQTLKGTPNIGATTSEPPPNNQQPPSSNEPPPEDDLGGLDMGDLPDEIGEMPDDVKLHDLPESFTLLKRFSNL